MTKPIGEGDYSSRLNPETEILQENREAMQIPSKGGILKQALESSHSRYGRLEAFIIVNPQAIYFVKRGESTPRTE